MPAGPPASAGSCAGCSEAFSEGFGKREVEAFERRCAKGQVGRTRPLKLIADPPPSKRGSASTSSRRSCASQMGLTHRKRRIKARTAIKIQISNSAESDPRIRRPRRFAGSGSYLAVNFSIPSVSIVTNTVAIAGDSHLATKLPQRASAHENNKIAGAARRGSSAPPNIRAASMTAIFRISIGN